MPDLDRALKSLEISVSTMYWAHPENRLFFENVAMKKTVNKTNLIAIYFIALNNWPLEEVSEKLQTYQDRQQIVWVIILIDFKIIFQNQTFLLFSASFTSLHSLQSSSWFIIIDKHQEEFRKKESGKYSDPEDLRI